jgi:hypothetical protein
VLSEAVCNVQAKPERLPLSEELLSRHSASMDQLLEGQTGNGISANHQPALRRPKGDKGKAERAGKQIEAHPVAEVHQLGGLFDDDEAVEELMQGLQQLRTER